MKTSHLLSYGGALVVASAIAAVVIRTNAQPKSESNETEPLLTLPDTDGSSDVPSGPVLDTKTWELLELDGTQVQGEINSPEAILERFHAHLPIQNPEEHERIFPKTREMRAAIKDAVHEAHNPKSKEQHIGRVKHPDEREKLQRAIEGILNPKPVTGTVIDSPAGPWSNVLKPKRRD